MRDGKDRLRTCVPTYICSPYLPQLPPPSFLINLSPIIQPHTLFPPWSSSHVPHPRHPHHTSSSHLHAPTRYIGISPASDFTRQAGEVAVQGHLGSCAEGGGGKVRQEKLPHRACRQLRRRGGGARRPGGAGPGGGDVSRAPHLGSHDLDLGSYDPHMRWNPGFGATHEVESRVWGHT